MVFSVLCFPAMRVLQANGGRTTASCREIPAADRQIRKPCQQVQPVCGLRQPPVAHLGIPEHRLGCMWQNEYSTLARTLSLTFSAIALGSFGASVARLLCRSAMGEATGQALYPVR